MVKMYDKADLHTVMAVTDFSILAAGSLVSAFTPKANIDWRHSDSRFGRRADIERDSRRISFKNKAAWGY